jgi:hypothetical protein
MDKQWISSWVVSYRWIAADLREYCNLLGLKYRLFNNWYLQNVVLYVCKLEHFISSFQEFIWTDANEHLFEHFINSADI